MVYGNLNSEGSTAPSYCHRTGNGEKRFIGGGVYGGSVAGLSKLLSTNRKMLYAPVLTLGTCAFRPTNDFRACGALKSTNFAGKNGWRESDHWLGSNGAFAMNLRFWGVRGSIPTPELDRLRYGGNTACLEIGFPGKSEAILIDCGSGIRACGVELMRRHVSRIHILLTHFHWDHIQGLPSFAPLFQSGVEIVFYTDRPAEQARRLLGVLMAEPFFPVPFAKIGSNVEFLQIECGHPFHAGPLTIQAFHLNHPQGAVGFRAESDGQVLVHASDHEYGNPEIDAGLIRAAQNANLLVMDAQYTPEEYAEKVGWGHSSYRHATMAAEGAGVGRLVLFHHDPNHNDEFLDGMLTNAKQLFPRTEMAAEGKSMDVAQSIE